MPDNDGVSCSANMPGNAHASDDVFAAAEGGYALSMPRSRSPGITFSGPLPSDVAFPGGSDDMNGMTWGDDTLEPNSQW